MKTCYECRFSVMEDNGYSNWTVEGTEFSCAKKLHPDGTFDRFYGENPKMNFASQCLGFEKGEGLHIDVEGEAIEEFNEDEKVVWMMHNA